MGERDEVGKHPGGASVDNTDSSRAVGAAEKLVCNAAAATNGAVSWVALLVKVDV